MTTAMATLLHYIMENIWDQHGDPRVQSYPLMSSAWCPAAIIASYVLFSTWVGPWLMQRRAPFYLKPVLIGYNFSLTVFNAVAVWYILTHYNYGLDMFDLKYRPHSDISPETHREILINYVYICVKLVDLLDTVFFILRKKNSQATFLHVYHHSAMVYTSWVYFRLNGAFIATTCHFVLVNSAIHALMYAYYGIAGLGPQYQRYLWWKRYLTQLQIVQFLMIFAHGVYFCVHQQGYPLYFSVDVIVQAAIYLALFTRFYLKTYQNKKRVESIKAK